MRKLVKLKPLCLLLTLLLLFMISFTAPGVSADENVSGLKGDKTVTANKDGTYTVSLNIMGMEKTLLSKTATDFIFCFDRSGSMDNNSRLVKLKEAMQNVTDTILNPNSQGSEQNRIAVVSFAKSASTDIDFSSDAEQVKTAIGQITASGGTNYTEGLAEAASVKNNRTGAAEKPCVLVFLTDGVPTYAYTYTRSGRPTLRGSGKDTDNDNVINCNGATEAYLTKTDFVCQINSDGRIGISGFTRGRTYYAQNWMGKNVGSGNNQFGSCYVIGYDLKLNEYNTCLQTLAGDNFLEADSDTIEEALITVVTSVLSLDNVTITDTVTEPFDIEDLKKATVTLTRSNGTPVVLSDYTLTQNGQKVTLSGLKYKDTELGGEIPVSMSDGDVLTLTFTIKPTDATLDSVFRDPIKNTFETNVEGEDSAGSGQLGNEEEGSTHYVYYNTGVATIPTTKITLKKIEIGNPDNVLSGATFEIKRQNGDDWTSRSEVTTDENGLITFSGLPVGTYQIIETNAPDGYIKLENPIEFKVTYNGNNGLQITDVNGATLDESTLTLTVSNERQPVTLTVKKTIEGTAANQADQFPFTLSAEKYPGYVTDSEKVEDVSQEVGQNGSIEIKVPYGTTVKVAETDSKGYTATVTDGSLVDWKSDGSGYSGTITLTQDTSVTITNTKNAPVVTSFVTDNSGMTGIALVSVTLIGLGAAAIYLKKRHF